MDQAKVSSVSIIDAPRLEPRPVFPEKIRSSAWPVSRSAW
jgi:hypothetical protein